MVYSYYDFALRIINEKDKYYGYKYNGQMGRAHSPSAP